MNDFWAYAAHHDRTADFREAADASLVLAEFRRGHPRGPGFLGRAGTIVSHAWRLIVRAPDAATRTPPIGRALSRDAPRLP